jgi:methionyl-tRNA formyltransferase
MTRLRLVVFGTGGLLSMAVLRALADVHEIVAVVRPQARGRLADLRRRAGGLARRAGLRPSDPVTDVVRATRCRDWWMAPGASDRLARRINALDVDLLCVAHFPWRLAPSLIGSTRLGGINVHPSLLPRHRGLLPLFWIYYADDRQSGVTVHQLSDACDEGAILRQQAFDLPRGFPADDLNTLNARVAASLALETVGALARGETAARPQDPALATRAPMIAPGTPMVRFAEWDVERVWHFLAATYPHFIEPLTDERGHRLSYDGVEGYVRGEPPLAIGCAQRVPGGRLALSCLGGSVLLRADRNGA